MSYIPGHVPNDPQLLAEFLRRELRKVSDELQDVVFYRSSAVVGSLSAGVSANWKVTGNVLLISTSNTVTITGLSVLNPGNREIVLANVGTGVLVVKSEDSASSASYRFALAATYQLSANATAVCWYDPYAFRWRGIGRT
ncbi:hypothetical protein [Nitrospira sp. BLG_2]|uniref:hypothetical protein n=1 Tax=Nitrospira sp. BLG_2 TaxID=3397507 RepID=UPI003B9B0923